MRIDNLEEKIKAVDPNDNFTLVLDGLGLIFGKDDEWRVWFPTSWDHKIVVSVYEGIGGNLKKIEETPPLEPGTVISIKHKGAEPFSENPDFGETILNIGKYHTNLKLKSKKKLEKHGILLKLKDTK